jgi:hypothetical protein
MHQLRPYFFSGLVALFAVLAVVAGSDAVRVFHTYFRLLNSGVAADARVLQTHWVKPALGRLYPIPYVSYSFRTGHGIVQRGEGRVTRSQFEQLRRGSSIVVVFDPAYPVNSAPNVAEVLSSGLWSMGGLIVAVLVAIIFAREWRRRHRALSTTK